MSNLEVYGPLRVTGPNGYLMMWRWKTENILFMVDYTHCVFLYSLGHCPSLVVILMAHDVHTAEQTNSKFLAEMLWGE